MVYAIVNWDDKHAGRVGKVVDRIIEDGKVLFLLKLEKPVNEREKVQGVFFEHDQLSVVNYEVYTQLVQSVIKEFVQDCHKPTDFTLISDGELQCEINSKYLTIYHLGGIPTYFSFGSNVKYTYISMSSIRNTVRNTLK